MPRFFRTLSFGKLVNLYRIAASLLLAGNNPYLTPIPEGTLMAVLTFTSAAFCGEFLSRVFAAVGCYALGVLLLSAAIFRAAACLRQEGVTSKI